jgi:hypothetical protein
MCILGRGGLVRAKAGFILAIPEEVSQRRVYGRKVKIVVGGNRIRFAVGEIVDEERLRRSVDDVVLEKIIWWRSILVIPVRPSTS